MTNMLEKKFTNKDLGIELSSFIDKQQNIWFVGKDVAEILGYSNTKKAVLKHVDREDKQLICWGTQNGSGNNSDLRRKYYIPPSTKRGRWLKENYHFLFI